MSRPFRLDELARHVGGRIVGDPATVLEGVATLETARPAELSFLTNPRYRDAVRVTRAGALLVTCESGIEGKPLIECDEPYLALAKILALFHPAEPRDAGVSDLAQVASDARLGEEVGIGPFSVVESDVTIEDRVSVGAGCVLGKGSRVGEDSVLMPRVVLYPGTVVGRRCIVHTGVVLGGDGFGFATAEGQHHKVPQMGRVVVEDDVEMGANTTVDRGTLGETVIGRGSKLDNQVMIAHGVTLGEGCLIAAQSGIAGSTRVGKRVTIAGQSGISGHRRVADGTVLAAKSALFSDTEKAGLVAGVPAVDHLVWKRAQALARKFPEMRAEIRELRRRLKKLERLAAQED